jgi:CHAT domain-containing protein
MAKIHCLIAALCLGMHFAFPQSAAQSDFAAQVLTASTTGNTFRLDSLISTNRLAVKPIVDNLLAQTIRSDPAGEAGEFRKQMEIARIIASSFLRTYGERSLSLGVEYVATWTPNERLTKLLADSLHALATRLRTKAETRDSALALYERALTLYKSIHDKRGEGTTLGSLGFIYWYRNDPEKALSLFREGLEIRSRVDDQQLVGNSYNDIGSVYYNFLKKYPEAIEFHQRALAVRKRIGDKNGLGRTLDNMALDYWDSGDLTKAQEASEAAAQAHAEAGDKDRMSRSLHNCGILLTELGKYEEALLVHDRSIEIRQALGDKAQIAQAFDAKGVVYYRIGDYESAYANYQRALSLSEEVGDERGVASANYKCGIVLCDLGRTDPGFQAYRRSLEIFQKIADKQGALHAISNMGVAYIDMKEYVKGEDVLKKALVLSRELPDFTVEIINLTMLGNAQNFLGKFDSARQNYRSALDKARLRRDPELMWASLLGLGDLEEKNHAYEASIDYYTQALGCIDRIRGSISSEQFKISFADKKRYVYEAIVHLLTVLHTQRPTAGHDSRAFRIAESAKARAFLDLLSESLANVREGTDTLLLGRQDSLLAATSRGREALELLLQDPHSSPEAVANTRGTLDGLEREMRRVETSLRVNNPRLGALKYPEPVSLDEVQRNLLDPGTTLLEYAVGDSSSSLWVVTQNERRLFRLPTREILKNQVDVLRSLLQYPGADSRAAFSTAAYRAYQTLLQPAERHLKKGTRLIIVPDGELFALPFEILLTRKARSSFKDLPYLVRKYPVVYVQSATVLSTLKAQQRPASVPRKSDLIAFGDPLFVSPEDSTTLAAGKPGIAEFESLRGKLARLPYTAAEVKNIAALFPTNRVDVYIQEAASEERVKQPGLLGHYRFVHFATHGVINQRKPELSAIALSRNQHSQEDGLLRPSEILHLSLSADLVVLSACETALGKITKGEGLVGLTRSFMYAGTPSVVASLWSVADHSTTTFMQKFYEGMVVAKADKAEALRRAKLALCASDRYAHPFYWAPFVLIGDWKFPSKSGE